MARCSLVIFGIIAVFLLLSWVLLIGNMDAANLFPFVDTGWKLLVKTGTTLTCFPFGETVLFAMVFPVLNKSQETRKTVTRAVLIAGLMLLADDLRNIFVFGDLITNIQFPSFSAIAFISIGDFLERIESFGLLVWLFGSYIKICVCLYVGALCLSQTIGTQTGSNYRVFVVPLALLVVELAQFIYRNGAEMMTFLFQVWTWYSLPFQLLIPLILLVGLKIKGVRRKAKV